jgi:hypothetical protein
MANGYVIYDGASLLNGERIITIALTSKSKNSKTGDMMQTYIITPHDPRDASKHGWDSANCGDCIHRGTPTNDPNRKQAKGRTCYVKLYQGVLQVWRQWKKGAYPMLKGHDALAKLGKDKDVRVGTYGDGGSVPSYIWDSLLSRKRKHTAYCHQFDNPNSSFDATRYMVSADTLSTAKTHWRLGHRTFRIRKEWVLNFLKKDCMTWLCKKQGKVKKRLNTILGLWI